MRVGTGEKVSEDVERLRAALDASCVVGTWDWDHVTGAVIYDAGAAGLLMGDPALAGRAVYGLDTIARVHPADHDWLIEHVGRAVQAGGLVLAEYRVVAADGAVRWLLSRGRTYHDGAGCPVTSRGIMIDITEVREGGDRYMVNGPSLAGDPLDRTTDLALTLRQGLAPDTPGEVRAAVELLLISLGRALARSGRAH